MDRAKVGEIIVQRITGPQHRSAFAEYVPGKSRLRAEVTLLRIVKWTGSQAHEPTRIGLGVIRQDFCSLVLGFTQGARNIPAHP